MKYKQRQGMVDIWYINDNGEFAGLAIAMKAGDKILLDYFAIDADKRGKGYGSLALCRLQRHYSGKKFFLEIESTFGDSDNREQRCLRKQFYLSNNMKEIGILADVFGTEMELLGYGCTLSYDEYISVYREIYGGQKAEHIVLIKELD